MESWLNFAGTMPQMPKTGFHERGQELLGRKLTVERSRYLDRYDRWGRLSEPAWIEMKVSPLRRGWRALFYVSCAVLLLASGRAAAEPSFYDARVAPILERHCVSCHGEKKQKAELRLDSYAHVMKGGDAGSVVVAADAKQSELFRRITLPHDDEEVMPADGKPLLTASEIKIIELWIAGGASATRGVSEFPDAPALPSQPSIAAPLAPDWRPRAAEVAALAARLGVRLVPRSQVPTDGLVLRTASAPRTCDDEVVAQLAPVAELIVDAELARTKITDAALADIARWPNLRRLDLTQTAVTSAGVNALRQSPRLESLNLTETQVDARGVEELEAMPTLKRVWAFGTGAAGAQ